MNTRVAVSLSALATVLASGCGSGGGMQVASNACLNFGSVLAIKDRMDQSVTLFNSGEEIRFELAVTNNSNAPQRLYANSTCSAAVFEVKDANQQKVWNSTDGIACATLVPTAPHTYAPFETVNYPVSWGQQRSDTVPPAPPVLVPPGEYTVAAAGGLFSLDGQGDSADCRAALSKSGAFSIR